MGQIALLRNTNASFSRLVEYFLEKPSDRYERANRTDYDVINASLPANHVALASHRFEIVGVYWCSQNTTRCIDNIWDSFL